MTFSATIAVYRNDHKLTQFIHKSKGNKAQKRK